MKKESYLKLCNNPYKEKAEKLEKRAVVFSIIVSVVIAIIAVIFVFLS